MRLLHTADWHIGRRLHGFDLTDQQRDAFKQIEQIAKAEEVDGIIIAGDLYDRSLPAEQSVAELNQMLKQLNLHDHYPVYAISGNHDSATRLSIGSEWFRDTNMYIHTKVEQAIEPIELADTQLFLLPFFDPFQVRQFLQDDRIQHLDQAFDALVAEMRTRFNPNKKHVLVSHFFAAGSATTDSETKLTVGGLSAVPVDHLSNFDYVAMGHLHGKDAIHADHVQYSGSPVKFSLSEASQMKGVFIVDTNDVTERKFVPIKPSRDVVQLTDTFEHLIDPDYYEQINLDSYVGITLTNREQIPNLMAQLRKIYPHIIELKRQNGYDAQLNYHGERGATIRQRDPIELLEQFYQRVTQKELTDQQLKWSKESLQQINDGRGKK
ncbi:exonuclease SbcCD subunit D [Lactobacillaceae bacterium Melli_B3]